MIRFSKRWTSGPFLSRRNIGAHNATRTKGLIAIQPANATVFVLFNSTSVPASAPPETPLFPERLTWVINRKAEVNNAASAEKSRALNSFRRTGCRAHEFFGSCSNIPDLVSPERGNNGQTDPSLSLATWTWDGQETIRFPFPLGSNYFSSSDLLRFGSLDDWSPDKPEFICSVFSCFTTSARFRCPAPARPPDATNTTRRVLGWPNNRAN